MVEMAMKGNGNGRSERDWLAFGIPADELAFFEFWQNDIDTTTLPDADGRLGRLLEARALYQSVGELLKQQEQEAFFARMENLYRIPVNNSRLHFRMQQPSTPGQWATFVAQHQKE